MKFSIIWKLKRFQERVKIEKKNIVMLASQFILHRHMHYLLLVVLKYLAALITKSQLISTTSSAAFLVDLGFKKSVVEHCLLLLCKPF